MEAFFGAGYLGVGVGSNLIPKKLQQAEDWEQAGQAVQSFMKLVPKKAPDSLSQ